MAHRIMKRLFSAKEFEKGSEYRNILNAYVLTSEYMPSYKYMVWATNYMSDGTVNPSHPYVEHATRTKKEAEQYIVDHNIKGDKMAEINKEITVINWYSMEVLEYSRLSLGLVIGKYTGLGYTIMVRKEFEETQTIYVSEYGSFGQR